MFGAILGGVASLATSYFANKQSKKNAQTAFDNETAWNREMLQNAHQWQVEDLKKAGLNPILSANGAQSLGASATPAQVITPDLDTAVGAFNAQTLRKTQRMNESKVHEELKFLSAQTEKFNLENDQLKLQNEQLKMEVENLKNHPDLVELKQVGDNPMKLMAYAMSRVFGTSNSAKVIKEFTDKRDNFKYFGDEK